MTDSNPLFNPNNTLNEEARARELASMVASTRIGVKEGKTVEMKAGFSEDPEPKKTDHTHDAVPEQSLDQAHSMRHDVEQALRAAVLEETPVASEERPKLAPEKTLQRDLTKEIQAASAPRPLTVQMPVNQEKPDTLDNKAAVLHTLKQDVEGLVQNRKISMLRAAALESDKNVSAAELQRDPIREQQSSWLLVSAVIIAILALITAGATYYSHTVSEELSADTLTQARYDTALVFFEHVQPFEITDLESYELRGGLAQLRGTIPATLGSITLIDFLHKRYDPTVSGYITEPVDLGSFLQTLKPHMPETLLSSLTGDYFVGVHAIEENAPLILLKVASADHAFAGMLDWEKQIGQDLQPFFESRGVPVGGEILQFSDLSIDSIDARVVRGADGNIRIIYAIIEKNVLVITDNIQTLREIADRVHTQILKRKGVNAQGL
jgi:hypothetical protein